MEHMRRSPDELIGRGAHPESRKLDLAQQGSSTEISLVTNKKGLNISQLLSLYASSPSWLLRKIIREGEGLGWDPNLRENKVKEKMLSTANFFLEQVLKRLTCTQRILVPPLTK